MEYRKKPVVIEAFRYGMDSRPDWFDTKVTSNDIITYVGTDIRDSSEYYCEIKTLEGIMRGNCGDYIIKGVQGEVYPCKPDIFEMTYELASTSSKTLKENHIVDTNEMIDHIGDANKMVDQVPDVRKMVEAEEKPMRYHCVPKEISDEVIEEASSQINYGGGSMGWIKDAFKQGAKWYREQLKKK